MISSKDAGNFDYRKIIKGPIGDGLIITTVAAATAGIFFGLRTVDIEQQNALLVSTAFTYVLSLVCNTI